MVNQGDIIKLDSFGYSSVVISKYAYNESGRVIACPITKKATSDVSFYISQDDVEGYVQCDNMRMIDLSSRFYSQIGSVGITELIGILGMTTSIFDLV